MFDFLSYASAAHKRVRWLGLAIGLLFVIFTLRLFYIQILQHNYYAAAAYDSQVTKLTIFPSRGTILARDGNSSVPLVLNETVYTVFADPAEVDDATKVKESLQRIAGGGVVKGAFDLLNNKKNRYVVLAKQVSRIQANLIDQEQLAGVGLQAGSRRVYPEGSLASQLLGYVNTDGIGQYGIEEFLNDRLGGKTGLLQSVTDVRRIPLTIGNENIEKPAVNGDNLVLTIDRKVQAKVEESLKSYAEKVGSSNASAVVMDPSSGQIVAMANFPTYDPSNYSQTTDYALFLNRTISNAYEAGSVIKTLTVAAGLDAKVITPGSTSPNNNGCTNVEDRVICNVLRAGIPTRPTTQQLLTYSLNTGAVDVVRQLGGGQLNKAGRDKLYGYLTNNYRFATTTGVEQVGESKGTVYSPEDQEGNNVRYANMAFGQGMTTTMMQVVSAFSAIVNGGTYYRPTLVYGTTTADGSIKQVAPTVVNSQVIAPEFSAQMRDMIWHVRYDQTGKAIDPAGYRIGGKSGTAQTIDPKTGQYTTDKTVGSYIGYVGNGAETPQYVIMVRMDDARGGVYVGSATANAMFGEVAHWMINNMHILPGKQ